MKQGDSVSFYSVKEIPQATFLGYLVSRNNDILWLMFIYFLFLLHGLQVELLGLNQILATMVLNSGSEYMDWGLQGIHGKLSRVHIVKTSV